MSFGSGEVIRPPGGPEQAAEELLIRFGHLRKGEPLGSKLKDDLASGVLSTNDLQKICSTIDAAKGPFDASHTGLTPDTLKGALLYQLHNLSGLNFHGQISSENLSGFDLSSSHLQGAHFIGCDFGDANVDRMHFETPEGELERPIQEEETNRKTIRFTGSILTDIQLSSIVIGEQILDLTDGALEVDSKYWDISSNDGSVGSCAGAEMYHKALLELPDKRAELDTGYSEYAKRGVIVFEGGEPLGILKLKNEHSFLPLRTVRNRQGQTIFWKGMIYALANPLLETLYAQSLPHKEETQWRRADIESVAQLVGGPFKRDNRRFVYDPQIYSRLSEVREGIRSEKVPLIDIMSPKSV